MPHIFQFEVQLFITQYLFPYECHHGAMNLRDFSGVQQLHDWFDIGGTPLSLDGLEFISMENTNLKWMTGGTSSHQETSI